VRSLSIPAGVGTAVVVATVLVGACRPRERENVIAVVGVHRVELGSFQGYVAGVLGEPWQSVDGRLASRLLDQFLDQELVAAAARRKREMAIPLDPGKRSAAVRAMLEKVCGPPPTPSAREIDRAVAERMKVIEPERVRVRQMLLDTEAEARAAERRLRRGADFVELSRQVSRAPNAQDGGSLGVIDKGTLPADLEEVVFALRPGKFSQPVRSPAGFHIFQVLEKIPAGHPRRSEVERDVRRELTQNDARAYLRQCVDRLAKEVGARVIPEHLWFPYNGRYSEDHNGSK